MRLDEPGLLSNTLHKKVHIFSYPLWQSESWPEVLLAKEMTTDSGKHHFIRLALHVYSANMAKSHAGESGHSLFSLNNTAIPRGDDRIDLGCGGKGDAVFKEHFWRTGF